MQNETGGMDGTENGTDIYLGVEQHEGFDSAGSRHQSFDLAKLL
jgi:hypothetical protein